MLKLLWTNINYGLPLLEKVDKTIMDSVVIDILLTHPDVKSILKFVSKVENNVYKIEDLEILSIFNEKVDLV